MFRVRGCGYPQWVGTFSAFLSPSLAPLTQQRESHSLHSQGKCVEIFTMFENTLKSFLFILFAGSAFYAQTIPTEELPPIVANINLQS